MFSDVYVDNQGQLYIMKVMLILAILILINHWFSMGEYHVGVRT